jgi:hypothetical protein
VDSSNVRQRASNIEKEHTMSTHGTFHEPTGASKPDSSHSSSALFFWGLIALLGGALMILNMFVNLDLIMPWIVLGAGLVMLIWGMFVRSIGGLIAGGIVTGMGVGLTLVGETSMDASGYTISTDGAGMGYFLLCLALGFLSIPLTTRIFAGRTHWWALIPGGILFLIGLAMIFGGAYFLQALTLVQVGGALALIALGGWLIYQYSTHGKTAA